MDQCTMEEVALGTLGTLSADTIAAPTAERRITVIRPPSTQVELLMLTSPPLKAAYHQAMVAAPTIIKGKLIDVCIDRVGKFNRLLFLAIHTPCLQLWARPTL